MLQVLFVGVVWNPKKCWEILSLVVHFLCMLEKVSLLLFLSDSVNLERISHPSVVFLIQFNEKKLFLIKKKIK